MRCLAALICLWLAAPAAAEDLVGQAGFVSGDTITIDGRTVRLYGIDAPEMDQHCTDAKGKPFNCGHASMRRLFLYVGADPLHCSVHRRDPDGAVAATCRVKSYFKHTETGATKGELFDVALEMVLTGHALADPNQGPDYVAAEAQAKARKLGLWAGAFERPGDWRRKRQQAKDTK